MSRAFREAAQSDWVNTAPNPLVGALALKGGHVVGYGHHRFFGDAHAEEMALESAPEADEMFVTLEPCLMCASAISEVHIEELYFGAYDNKNGGIEKLRVAFQRQNIFMPTIYGGIMEKECSSLLKKFFKNKSDR